MSGVINIKFVMRLNRYRQEKRDAKVSRPVEKSPR